MPQICLATPLRRLDPMRSAGLSGNSISCRKAWGMRRLASRRVVLRSLVGLAAGIVLAGVLAGSSIVAAQEVARPLPRFASLDSDKVRMRAGPGSDYPILWEYHRKGLPVEIIEEFDT